jgi:hypothetical protein
MVPVDVQPEKSAGLRPVLLSLVEEPVAEVG